MPKLKQISQKSTYDLILEELEERILNGNFAQGELLPSEAKLAEQLGVGRRALREVLRVLELKGMIKIQKGVGARVTRNDLDSFLSSMNQNIVSYLSMSKANLQHVKEMRMIVESAAITKQCTQGKPGLINKLLDNIEQQIKANDNNDSLAYQKYHFKFHKGIVNALENPLITMVYEQVLNIILAPMHKTGGKPGVKDLAIAEHKLIVEAMQVGNVEKAQGALEEHLNRSVSRMSSLGMTDTQ